VGILDGAIITAVIPFATTIFKKIFKTDKIIDDEVKHGLNGLVPVILGIAGAFLRAYQTGQYDFVTCLTMGLVSGSVASTVRDVDKNLLGIANTIIKLFKK